MANSRSSFIGARVLTSFGTRRIVARSAGLPAGLGGLELCFQCAIADGAAVQDVALSNAVQAAVP
jgi:hypothetical protein